MEKYINQISINPEIRFGKPCIKGTRITVSDIFTWLASGMTYEEILEDFPVVTQENIFTTQKLLSMNNTIATEDKITNLVNDILLLMQVNKHIAQREQYSLIHNLEMDNGLKTFFVKRQKVTKQIYKILLDIDIENPLIQTITTELVEEEERPAFDRQLNYHVRKVEALLVL